MLLLTNGGRDLLARTVAGETGIVFTKVQRGNGSDQGRTATALGNSLLEVGISSYEINVDGTITLHWNYNNANVFSGFRATELGIFAVEDEDDADDPTAQILFAYEYCPSADADYVPANSSGRIVTTSFDTDVYIGDATDVSVVISESAIYATKAELDALADEVDNLGPSDVGLGNVPNVITNEQTPTYTVATALSNLASGEHLGVAFGKIAKAISSLINHLSDRNNPHGVSASQIGAAVAEHQHGAADITSGILSTARGGTGNTQGAAQKLSSSRLLRVNLENYDAVAFNGAQDVLNIGAAGVLPKSKGGTGRVDGRSAGFDVSRNLQVNLESSALTPFDGTSDASIGVDGVLPLVNGGTGVNSLSDLKEMLGLYSTNVYINLPLPSGATEYSIPYSVIESDYTGSGTMTSYLLTQEVLKQGNVKSIRLYRNGASLPFTTDLSYDDWLSYEPSQNALLHVLNGNSSFVTAGSGGSAGARKPTIIIFVVPTAGQDYPAGTYIVANYTTSFDQVVYTKTEVM